MEDIRTSVEQLVSKYTEKPFILGPDDVEVCSLFLSVPASAGPDQELSLALLNLLNSLDGVPENMLILVRNSTYLSSVSKFLSAVTNSEDGHYTELSLSLQFASLYAFETLAKAPDAQVRRECLCQMAGNVNNLAESMTSAIAAGIERCGSPSLQELRLELLIMALTMAASSSSNTIVRGIKSKMSKDLQKVLQAATFDELQRGSGDNKLRPLLSDINMKNGAVKSLRFKNFQRIEGNQYFDTPKTTGWFDFSNSGLFILFDSTSDYLELKPDTFASLNFDLVNCAFRFTVDSLDKNDFVPLAVAGKQAGVSSYEFRAQFNDASDCKDAHEATKEHMNFFSGKLDEANTRPRKLSTVSNKQFAEITPSAAAAAVAAAAAAAAAASTVLAQAHGEKKPKETKSEKAQQQSCESCELVTSPESSPKKPVKNATSATSGQGEQVAPRSSARISELVTSAEKPLKPSAGGRKGPKPTSAASLAQPQPQPQPQPSLSIAVTTSKASASVKRKVEEPSAASSANVARMRKNRQTDEDEAAAEVDDNSVTCEESAKRGGTAKTKAEVNGKTASKAKESKTASAAAAATHSAPKREKRARQADENATNAAHDDGGSNASAVASAAKLKSSTKSSRGNKIQRLDNAQDENSSYVPAAHLDHEDDATSFFAEDLAVRGDIPAPRVAGLVHESEAERLADSQSDPLESSTYFNSMDLSGFDRTPESEGDNNIEQAFGLLMQKLAAMQADREKRKVDRLMEQAVSQVSGQITEYLGSWVQLHQDDLTRKENDLVQKCNTYVELNEQLNASVSKDFAEIIAKAKEVSADAANANELYTNAKRDYNEFSQRCKDEDKRIKADLAKLRSSETEKSIKFLTSPPAGHQATGGGRKIDSDFP